MIEFFNSEIRRLKVCDYCNGSKEILHTERDKDFEPEQCPKCLGEGQLYQTITIVTRPVTREDRVKFRKVF